MAGTIQLLGTIAAKGLGGAMRDNRPGWYPWLDVPTLVSSTQASQLGFGFSGRHGFRLGRVGSGLVARGLGRVGSLRLQTRVARTDPNYNPN